MLLKVWPGAEPRVQLFAFVAGAGVNELPIGGSVSVKQKAMFLYRSDGWVCVGFQGIISNLWMQVFLLTITRMLCIKNNKTADCSVGKGFEKE